MRKTKVPRKAIKTIFYRYFSELEREDVYNYTKRLSKYLVKEKIKNIAFVDRSARGAWVGLNTYWNLHLDISKKPRMYFFNPDGFASFQAKEDFPLTFRHLMGEKDETLILFDTCAHTGDTLRSIIKTLHELKFTEVEVITATSPGAGSYIRPACTIDQDRNVKTCCPFGSADLIDKTNTVICKKKGSFRKEAIQTRKELRHIILEKGR